jgi:hypothetical protein
MGKKKPFFALVVNKDHHEQRVKEFGLRVDERAHPNEYNEFKSIVTQRLCAFWSDKKDIKAAIFQKLPEWAQKSDLIGWVRADEATNPEVMNELARLSGENWELRSQMKSAESFDGLEFEDLVRLLEGRKLLNDELKDLPIRLSKNPVGDAALGRSGDISTLQFFQLGFDEMASGFRLSAYQESPTLLTLIGFGLLRRDEDTRSGLSYFAITEAGRRLRNGLLSRQLRAGTPD